MRVLHVVNKYQFARCISRAKPHAAAAFYAPRAGRVLIISYCSSYRPPVASHARRVISRVPKAATEPQPVFLSFPRRPALYTRSIPLGINSIVDRGNYGRLSETLELISRCLDCRGSFFFPAVDLRNNAGRKTAGIIIFQSRIRMHVGTLHVYSHSSVASHKREEKKKHYRYPTKIHSAFVAYGIAKLGNSIVFGQ